MLQPFIDTLMTKLSQSALLLLAQIHHFSRSARQAAYSRIFILSRQLMSRHSCVHCPISSVPPIHSRPGCWRQTPTFCRHFCASWSTVASRMALCRPASNRATLRHCWRKQTSTRPKSSHTGQSPTCPSSLSCSNGLSHSSWPLIWRIMACSRTSSRRIVPITRLRPPCWMKVVGDSLLALDSGNLALLSLLDLSAAFHAVDHDTLLRQLQMSYGLDGVVIK